MKYKYIIFDFDGTINNTEEGITNSFKATLDLYGIEHTNIDFRRHIGPPLEFSFRELVGDDRWEQAVTEYRKIFSQSGAVDQCHVYDGIIEVLDTLHQRGYILSIATSKYQPYALQSLAKLGIMDKFDVVYGQTERRGYKNEILAQLIGDHDWDKSQCLMVGDTHYDVEGAHANNIDVLAVTYGFETREQLLECEPTYIVDSTTAILELL